MTGRPVRIQLSRKKGFNLQEASKAINGLEAVSVARPTKWGNPFVIGGRGSTFSPTPDDAAMAVRWFRGDLKRLLTKQPSTLEPLRGKNLACWCPLDQPCHADVLLQIANTEQEGG